MPTYRWRRASHLRIVHAGTEEGPELLLVWVFVEIGPRKQPLGGYPLLRFICAVFQPMVWVWHAYLAIGCALVDVDVVRATCRGVISGSPGSDGSHCYYKCQPLTGAIIIAHLKFGWASRSYDMDVGSEGTIRHLVLILIKPGQMT
jgi:hypothetical protein